MTALRKTPVALLSDAAPFAIRAERASDVVAREALLDACFGANRHTRTCQRLRDGRAPAEGLALSVVRQGRLVGTVRLWHVSAGGDPALVLGPLAVDASCRELGVGAALMNHALAAAKARGHGAVILLGDAPYYARFGFSALKTGELSLPGPFERDRLLGLELREGALDGAWGMIAPTGVGAKAGSREQAPRPCRRRPDRHAGKPCPATNLRRLPRRHTILMIMTGHDRQGHTCAGGPGCDLRRDTARGDRGLPPATPKELLIEVPMPRRLISTGSPFEKTAGYSRAVIDGDFAFVAGTTGYDYATMTMPADVTSQSRNCFKTIEAALEGRRLRDGRYRPRDLLHHRRQGCGRPSRGLRRSSRRDPPGRHAARRRRASTSPR